MSHAWNRFRVTTQVADKEGAKRIVEGVDKICFDVVNAINRAAQRQKTFDVGTVNSLTALACKF